MYAQEGECIGCNTNIPCIIIILLSCSQYVDLIDLTKDSESDSDGELPIVNVTGRIR